jgi:alkaline phosphatase D
MTARTRKSFPDRAAALKATLAAAAFALPLTADAGLVLMHGYVDYTSALLWIQTGTPGPVEIAWTVDGAAAATTITLRTNAAEDNVVVARLGELLPGQLVRYRVSGDGERRDGTLKTQPQWEDAQAAPDIAIAFGSCFFLADAGSRWGGSSYGGGFEIFDAIAAKKPDFMVWLGDNLYFQKPDFLDPAALAARHLRQRAFPPLSKLLTATSHLAIWDDHDYGPNDSDASYTMKGETLKLFRRYWANPSYGLPETPGVFGYARLGDVDLFLLDDRYYRSANKAKDSPGKTMLGHAQLAWLRAALIGSSARIKLIANGNQVLNRVSRFEGWHQFPTEHRAFLDFLIEQKIEGVVFLSGDRHFGELLRIERPGAYPLHEFTSSPLTSSPWELPEQSERQNPDVVQGTLVGKRQFGMIRVTGPADDRRLQLSSHDQTGAELWRHELRVNSLRFPRTAGGAN